jgi:hypothetical protein
VLLHVPQPGKIEEPEKGHVFVFDITQGFIFLALVFVTILVRMIFLFIALPARVSTISTVSNEKLPACPPLNCPLLPALHNSHEAYAIQACYQSSSRKHLQ